MSDGIDIYLFIVYFWAQYLRGVLKIRNFEADEILKPQFTIVNEDFKIEVQRRKSNF